MSLIKLSKHQFSKNTTPYQSSLISPQFSRSQRNTHQSLQSLNKSIKKQFTLSTITTRNFQQFTSRNFISQKTELFDKIDQKINENSQKIKRKLTIQKLNSKMSIISMQRSKFKISRNNSITRLSRPKYLNPLDITTNQSRQQLNQYQKHEKNGQKILLSTTIRREGGCYNVTNQIESFKEYLKILSLNHPKRNKGRKAELLTRRLLKYFIEANQQDIKKDLREIKAISGQLIKCLSQNKTINLNILRHVDRDIAKLIFNVCYQIYRKKQKSVTHTQLIKINKQIEYTSRRLNFFQITLRTCFDLGKIYSDQMKYDNAFKQYTHAVKLAIFIGNKYYQQIAIDKLGLSKYYAGDSISSVYFHNNINHLSEYDVKKIKDEYSNESQIKRLIQEKKELRNGGDGGGRKRRAVNQEGQQGKENCYEQQQPQQKIDIGQFNFKKQNRKQFYPITNNYQFKRNLKKIIKIPQLRTKIHVLKRNLKKNDLIGEKKYSGQNYVIPTASMCSRKQNFYEYNQVCLSHRSYNRYNIENEIVKIQKDSKSMINTLNYFLNENFLEKLEEGNKYYYNVITPGDTNDGREDQ